MRRVWLVFKIVETVFGLACLGYHTRGFLKIEFLKSRYEYIAVFGGFTLMSMFGCISISLKETVHPLWEGIMNLVAAISFICVSVNSMYHSEKDFYLTYLSAGNNDDWYEDVEEDYEELPYPFFKYSKGQSMSALFCGCLFYLHSVLAFDAAYHNKDDSDANYSFDEDMEYGPLNLYVFGKDAHEWLEKFEWFRNLSDKKNATT